MEKKNLLLPDHGGYEEAYELAYKLACEKLAGINDIEQQCRKSGAQYRVTDSQKAIIIQYLGQSYLITLPDIGISLADGVEGIPIREKVLILHYFISAKGTPLANRLITFRELPEGIVYFPTFSKRTMKPLLGQFGKEPRHLMAVSQKLGGHKADYGDTAVTINAFSRVPITIVLWRGDDEFAPEGGMLFDAAISDYLPTEDITVLCEIVTWRLINLSRGSRKPRTSG